MKLFDLLLCGASQSPEKAAVVHGDHTISYRDLLVAVVAVARELQRLPRGSRVAILSENSVNYVISFFAVCRAGLVVVPLDTSLKPEKLHDIIVDCGASTLMVSNRYASMVDSLVSDESPVELVLSEGSLSSKSTAVSHMNMATLLADVQDATLQELADSEIDRLSHAEPLLYDNLPECSDDLAAIFYTSGSTGDSKGVMLSHRNLITNTIATNEYLKLTAEDSVIVILPFYYIYGNSLMLTHVACGGQLVVENRFAYPQVVLQTMVRCEVTGFSGVPSNFMILLNNAAFTQKQLPHLRYLTQAGGAMPPHVIENLIDVFRDREIYIMYGQTEASPRISYLPPEMLVDNVGSVGVPLKGVAVQICDEAGNELPRDELGEVVVSGDLVMMGYWNQPDEQDQVLKAGRLYTGDLGRIDDDGLLWIVSRKKEIIKVGGHRVSAREVEECIAAHPAIAEVAVVGVPDDTLGEALKAVVVLSNDQTADAKAIQDHCKLKLGPTKAPRHVIFTDALPRYQSGKVNKLALT